MELIDSLFYALISLGVLWLLFTFAFVISWKFNLWKIVDIMWGGGFLVIVGLGEFLNQPSRVPLIIVTLVFLWGFRLIAQLSWRLIQNNKEDQRYNDLKGKSDSILKSYTNIFLLQAFLTWIMCIPFYFYFTISVPKEWNFLLYVGVSISIFALIYETIADIQMSIFKQPKQLVKNGLWKYSRHPNYFGEICFWWGLWIAMLSAMPIALGIVSIISPLTITLIITYVTGPMLEHQMSRYDDWTEYKLTTPYIIPKILK